MVGDSTQTVTVDRISNSGNAIAQQRQAGKTILVPAGEVGETLDVRLVDKGSYLEARLVDRTEETRPRQPSVSPDTSDVGSDLVDPSSSSHSYNVRNSPASGSLRSKTVDNTAEEVRDGMSMRKK